jgi:hypothetical protein
LAKYNYNHEVGKDEMDRAGNTHGGKRNPCRVSVGKPEEESH